MSDDQGNPWKLPNLRIPPPNGEPSRKRSEPKAEETPAPFTPGWHAERANFFAKVARTQKARGVVWSDGDRMTSRLALDLSSTQRGMVGFEEARAAYERDGGKRLEKIMGHPLPPPAKGGTLKMPKDMAEEDYPF